MIVAENREILVAEPIDELDGAAGVSFAGIAPGRKERGGDVALLAGAALGEMRARGRELLRLDRLNAQGEMGEAIVWFARDQAAGQCEGFGHVAVRDGGDESALDQARIAWIEPQRLAKKRRRRHCVALGAGDKGGEIIPRWAFPDLEWRGDRQILPRPRLRAREGGGKKKGRDAGQRDSAQGEATPRAALILAGEFGLERHATAFRAKPYPPGARRTRVG